MNTIYEKLVYVLILLILALLGLLGFYAYTLFFGSSSDPAVQEPVVENVSANNLLGDDVINIALFGVDGRSDAEGDRSDTIIIASVDTVNNRITLTSVVRDSFVRVPATDSKGVTYEKINSAYSYGGPYLAVKTVNENFDLNIRDYVCVDFNCLVKIVDIVGGVDVTVENEDVLEWTNAYIDDVNDKVGKADPYIEGTGPRHLTGVQALAYCRNRYSDDDFKRTERQREVIISIMNNANSLGPVKALSLVSGVYPYIETSLSFDDILTYGKAYFAMTGAQLVTQRLYTEELSTGGMKDSVWYLFPNSLLDNARVIHESLYGNYVPSSTVIEISSIIAGGNFEDIPVSDYSESQSDSPVLQGDPEVYRIEEYSP